MNTLEPRRRAVICDPPAVRGVATLLWHLGGDHISLLFLLSSRGFIHVSPSYRRVILCTNHLLQGVSPLLYISKYYYDHAPMHVLSHLFKRGTTEMLTHFVFIAYQIQTNCLALVLSSIPKKLLFSPHQQQLTADLYLLKYRVLMCLSIIIDNLTG